MEWQQRAGLAQKGRKRIRHRQQQGWRRERARAAGTCSKGEPSLEMKSERVAKAKS